jgi:hypothetical protein
MASPRIDAVFHKLGNRLQRIVLRQSDDGDSVPVFADSELAAVRRFPGFGASSLFLVVVLREEPRECLLLFFVGATETLLFKPVN